jgi:hypothetical protein
MRKLKTKELRERNFSLQQYSEWRKRLHLTLLMVPLVMNISVTINLANAEAITLSGQVPDSVGLRRR